MSAAERRELRELRISKRKGQVLLEAIRSAKGSSYTACQGCKTHASTEFDICKIWWRNQRMPNHEGIEQPFLFRNRYDGSPWSLHCYAVECTQVYCYVTGASLVCCCYQAARVFSPVCKPPNYRAQRPDRSLGAATSTESLIPHPNLHHCPRCCPRRFQVPMARHLVRPRYKSGTRPDRQGARYIH